MENEIKIAADQVALRLLVSQLYMHKFFEDSGARDALPELVRRVTRQDADEAIQRGGMEAALLAQVHRSVDSFFTEVETNLIRAGL